MNSNIDRQEEVQTRRVVACSKPLQSQVCMVQEIVITGFYAYQPVTQVLKNKMVLTSAYKITTLDKHYAERPFKSIPRLISTIGPAASRSHQATTC